jgi:zinc protease
VITPTAGPESYMPVNKNGAQRGHRPFVSFFDKRLEDVRIVSGLEHEPIITDTFILVPNSPLIKRAQEIKIIFKAKES